MAFIDYYKILGVDRNIPQKDVRAAYRKRAKQFHPDLHPNDPKAKAKFQALSEAFEVIGDPGNTINTENSGAMLKPMKMLVALVDSKVDKVEEIPLADLTLAVSVMAEVALAASSKTSSEAVDVVVHLVSTLVERKVNVLQDKWRLLLA